MAIDLRRLRLMNQDAQGVVDITRPMGSSGYGPDDQEYEPPPQYDTGEEYSYGRNDQPTYEDPDERQYASPATMDPRTPVNPSIAPPVAGPGSTADESMNRTIEAINRIYRPEYTSRDRLNRLLDAAPERERPSVLSGIAAFGMGMSAKDPMDALKIHESVMFAPHHRDMADWTAKTGPFSNAAQYENTANINERTLAGNVVTAQTQADRLAENARQADQKNEVARITANARAAMAAKYTIKEENGRVMAYPPDPRQGAPMDLGPSGLMNEREKQDLINAGRLAVEVQQGRNQMDVQGSRNAGQLAVQTLRNQRIIGNGGTRGLLPSQQKDALFNKAQEWILRHPEDKANITLDPAQRSFEVNEPSTSMFGNPKGMDPARYDEFVDYMYGGGGMQSPTTPSGMPTAPAAPTMPRGAGPQQQGQLDLTMPPNIDPHGRQPQAQKQEILQRQQGTPLPAATGTTPPTPQQLQAVQQIDQQIAELQAQLNAPPPPAFEPRPEYAPQGSRPLPTPQQPWIYEQAKKIFDPYTGPPAPSIYSPQVMGPQGPTQSPVRNTTEVNMNPEPSQQQQIQAQIDELKAKQQQILATPAPQQTVRVRMPDGQVGTVPASMVPNLPRGSQVIQ